MNQDLMTLAQIARELGVTPAALSNWKKRYGLEFPQPRLVSGSQRKFSLSEFHAFVAERGLGKSQVEQIIGDNGSPGAREEALYSLIARTMEVTKNPYFAWNEADLVHVAALSVAVQMSRGRIERDKLANQSSEILESALNEKTSSTPRKTIREKSLETWLKEMPDMGSQEIADVLYRFVENRGGVFGSFEHGTPQSVADLMSRVVKGARLLNIASGMGFIARGYAQSSTEFFGQEINPYASRFLSLLAMLEGLDATILCEDAIETCHLEWIEKPFDGVIVNPPWGQPIEAQNVVTKDPRWRALADIRSRSTLDYFIESALAYLKPTSGLSRHRAAVLVPLSWLTSGGASSRFRNYLVRAGYVETVVHLGGGLNQSTQLAVALVVLSKPDTYRDSIRMVDARELGEIVRSGPRIRQRVLSEGDIAEILQAIDSPLARSVGSVGTIDVNTQDLLTDRVDLNPVRYTSSTKPRVSPAQASEVFSRIRAELMQRLSIFQQTIESCSSSSLAAIVGKLRTSDVKVVELGGSGFDFGVKYRTMSISRGQDWPVDEFRKDDIVVCLAGPALGAVSLGADFLSKKFPWSRVAVLRTTMPSVSQDYLMVWAVLGGLRDFFESKRESTTPFVGRRVIDQVTIPIPDLASQELIVEWAKPLLEALRMINEFGGERFRGSAHRAPSASQPGLDASMFETFIDAASDLFSTQLARFAEAEQ